MKTEEHPGVDEVKEREAGFDLSPSDARRIKKYKGFLKDGIISQNTYNTILATMNGSRDKEIIGG